MDEKEKGGKIDEKCSIQFLKLYFTTKLQAQMLTKIETRFTDIIQKFIFYLEQQIF